MLDTKVKMGIKSFKEQDEIINDFIGQKITKCLLNDFPYLYFKLENGKQICINAEEL